MEEEMTWLIYAAAHTATYFIMFCLFKRLEVYLRAEGDILNIYSDGEFLKQFIYFQKCIYVFIMCGILTITLDSLFSTDDL
jgi:hypothetical protein